MTGEKSGSMQLSEMISNCMNRDWSQTDRTRSVQPLEQLRQCRLTETDDRVVTVCGVHKRGPEYRTALFYQFYNSLQRTMTIRNTASGIHSKRRMVFSIASNDAKMITKGQHADIGMSIRCDRQLLQNLHLLH
ncbi:hypothetical protein CY34DRAFT_373877 [Suillus luteus UH-Slu-Lm8-n1]|uniref:Uncharacterized protein n=1 Tax=Suillus luteus UH-Slu-Lm8-n1 TaxID=930992 RepID=A0A0D0AKR1_9AGAM|nr:hypothetical protein CY34DRAFT_373877 [Suillus luteus UH-Slu-Lm8-n1]